MIKANDLRLGNYILHDGNPYKVVRLNDAEVSFFNEKDKCRWTVTSNKVEPIELTPELLEKAGFMYSDENQINNYDAEAYVKDNVIIYTSLYDEGVFWLNAQSSIGGKFIQPNFRNLHQLQNLYYALTGTELSITL